MKQSSIKDASDASSAQPGSTFWFSGGLILVLIGAIALRVLAVEKASFWLDEFWTLELSCGHDTAHEHWATNTIIPQPHSLTALSGAGPWWTVWTTLSEVTHPPLFFLLLRIWREALGPSDMAARLLPCLASVAAVALLYKAMRDLHGPAPALWAALLMALAGQQLYFSQETRSYSLIAALGLLACVAVISIEKRGDSWPRVIGLAACALAMVLTHYFTIGGVLAIVAYAMIRLPRRAKIRIVLTMTGAGAVFLAIWGPFFLKQGNAFSLEAGKGGAYFLLEHSPHHVLKTLYRLIAVPAQTLAVGALPDAGNWVPWFVAPVLLLFLAPLIWIRRQPGLWLWYLWTAGVLLPLMALDLTRSSTHLQFPKYTMLAGAGVCGVLAAGFDTLPRRFKHIPPALVALGAACFVPSVFHLIEQTKPDWQPMVTIMSDTIRPGEPIMYAAQAGAGGQVFLYVSHYLTPIEQNPAVILVAPPTPSLERELRSHERCWIVYEGLSPALFKLLPHARIEQRGGVLDDPTDPNNHNLRAIFGQVIWQQAAP